MVRIDINIGPDGNINEQPSNTKTKLFLTADMILKYIATTDEAIDTLITCKNTDYDFVTTDLEVYNALGSIQSYDQVNINRLKKLFEVTTVDSFEKNSGRPKPILTQEKVGEIRKLALKVK